MSEISENIAKAECSEGGILPWPRGDPPGWSKVLESGSLHLSLETVPCLSLLLNSPYHNSFQNHTVSF